MCTVYFITLLKNNIPCDVFKMAQGWQIYINCTIENDKEIYVLW